MELDSKAIQDLDRVCELMATPECKGKKLLLLGFSDNAGPSRVTLRMSKDRAQSIAREFTVRGIEPAVATGFGAVLPVGSNNTEYGRDKNRRVEVWIR